MWQQKKPLNEQRKKCEIKSRKELLILHLIETVISKEFLLRVSIFFLEINYEIKVKSTDNIVYEDEGRSAIHLTIFGDNGSSGPLDLRGDEHDSKKFNGQSVSLKKKAFDAGKVGKRNSIY
jgi:hypothetical protein